MITSMQTSAEAEDQYDPGEARHVQINVSGNMVNLLFHDGATSETLSAALFSVVEFQKFADDVARVSQALR